MRKLIASLLVMTFLVLPLAASSVRTNSMNIGADDVEDIGNIITFPQLTSLYKNKVWYNDSYAGMGLSQTILLCELSSYTVGVGITEWDFILNPGPIGATGYQIMDYLGIDNGLVPETVAHLFFAGDVGTGQAGVNLFWATGAESNDYMETDTGADPTWTDGDGYEDSASYLGIILGYGMEDVGPLARLDASLGIGLPGYSAEYTDPLSSSQLLADPQGLPYLETTEKDGGMDLEINVQGIKEQSEETTLRIGLIYAASSFDELQTIKEDFNRDGDYIDGVDTHDEAFVSRSSSLMALTGVVNKKVNDSGLLVVGTGLVMSSDDSEHTEKSLADGAGTGTYQLELQNLSGGYDASESSGMWIPLSIAIEDEIRENWIGRLGASKDILVMGGPTTDEDTFGVLPSGVWGKTGNTNNETSVRYADGLRLAMGVGTMLNNFTVNAEISNDILLGGPYFVTGDSSSFASAFDVIYSY